MISQPSTARMIDVVRRELSGTVAAAVGDPLVQGSLQMIDHILSTLAVRAQHEIAWMVDEIDALAALGRDVVAAEPAATGVAAAVAALDAAGPVSLHYDELSQRYSLASEILSCACEEVAVGSPARAAVEAALDARLAREVEIMGPFELVGRT